MESELQYYLKTRNSLTANIFYNLLANGMNCDAVARIDNLAEVDTPLLVINPGLLPEEQQEICNALNRRTEFRVLRTTYGLFDTPDAPKNNTEAKEQDSATPQE